MIEVKTNNADVTWRVYFYVNTYDIEAGNGDEKYWIDLLKSAEIQGKEYKPCVSKINAVQTFLPLCDTLSFTFFPTRFNSYYGGTITADECVRIGRGVFLKVVETVEGNEGGRFWVWHGRISGLRESEQVWDVQCISEWIHRINTITITDKEVLKHADTVIDGVSNMATSVKKLTDDYIYIFNNPYENINNLSFDKKNGCGVGEMLIDLQKEYQVMPNKVILKHRSMATILDDCATKRYMKITNVGGCTIDSDYGFVPYNKIILDNYGITILDKYIDNENEDIVFMYGEGTAIGNIVGRINWLKTNKEIINSVKFIYNGASEIQGFAISKNQYACLGKGNGTVPWESLYLGQYICNGTALNLVLQPTFASEYTFTGIEIGSFGHVGKPASFNIIVNWLEGESIIVRKVYPQKSLSIDPKKKVISFDEPITVPGDTTLANIAFGWTGSSPDPNNYWLIPMEYNTSDPYVYGELKYLSPEGLKGAEPGYYCDLYGSLYYAPSNNKVYEKKDINSIELYGLRTKTFKDMNVSDENVDEISTNLLRYFSTDCSAIDSCEFVVKRYSRFPFTFSVEGGIQNIRPNLLVRVYDKVNKIGSKTDPRLFLLQKIEFNFPECLFKLTLSGVTNSADAILWDILKNTQDIILSNL